MIHLFHINNVTIHHSCPRTVSVVVVLLYSVDFLIFSYLLLSVWGGENFKYPETECRHMNTNHKTNSINDKSWVLFLC